MTARNHSSWDEIFLSAAIEPELWPGALDEMAAQTGSGHGQLIGIGGGRDIPFNIVSKFGADHLQTFIDIGGGLPEVNFRIAANDRALALGHYDPVLYEKHYDAITPQPRSARYLDWCEEIGIPFGCQTNLVVDRVGLIGFALLRSRKDGVTTPETRRTFAAAAAAARRAVRLQERIEGNQALLLAGVFEAMSATAFILDARGRVQAMTETAEQLLSAGVIRYVDSRLDAAGIPVSLVQAVAALVADDGAKHVRFRLDGPERSQPIFMEGFRLPSRSWSLGNLPHAILLSKPPQRDRAGVGALLSALYRLTSTEADIAIRLFDGVTRDKICTIRRVTSETLRGQIKTICAKSGVENEAGLMRLLAAIMT